MAEQMVRERDAAVIELNDAIRQVERYLISYNPSVRILKQKIDKIDNKMENLKLCHYEYCRKAKIALDDPKEMSFITEKLDNATDRIDEGLVYIENNETSSENNKREKYANEAEHMKNTEKSSRIARVTSEITNEAKFATEMIRKMEILTDREEFSNTNAVLMRSYGERLREVYDNFNKSWKDVVSCYDTDEDLQRVAGEMRITATRLEIQDMLSRAEVFEERCRSIEDRNVDGDNATVESTFSSEINMLRPEKIKLPNFSGNIRNFARFRKDFVKIVVPFYPDSVHQAYVMKENCLKGDVKNLVENIEGIEHIWKRLEERYGDKMDLVEVVVKDLEKMPAMKYNEDQKFIYLVNTIEKGLQDLEAIGVRSEVANSYTVKMLESKLNRNMYLEWLKEEEKIDGESRFEKLFYFLKDERRRIEKLTQRTIVSTSSQDKPNDYSKRKQNCYFSSKKDIECEKKKDDDNPMIPGKSINKNNCLIHPFAAHFTRKCRTFLSMSPEERAEIVKQKNGCPFCLSASHIERSCPWIARWGPCKIHNCTKYHSHLLHEASIKGLIQEVSNSADTNNSNNTLLLVQEIPSMYGYVFSFFDSGSTISFVSRSFVQKNNLKGIKVSYDLTTVGGTTSTQRTYLHDIPLIDADGNTHTVQAFQIDEICGEMKNVDVSEAVQLFDNLSVQDVRRKMGHIELLIGMKHVTIHPKPISEADNLVLFESKFGTRRILAGTHISLKGHDIINACTEITARADIKNARVMCEKNVDPGIDFFTAEEFGVKLIPNCDRCKNCKNCTFQVHQISKVERRELDVIMNKLTLDPINCCWNTEYPYKVDPSILENNRNQALQFLYRTEKRLQRSEISSKQYKEQFDDFIRRGVFRKLDEKEIQSYNGPSYYVTHHEVFKEGSTSTPVRLVMNSSLQYKGRSLNDILMKGPNTLNDLFGIQMRFRCYPVPLVCDISKMYHSIKTTEMERHLRRVLWRNLDPNKPVETYGIETVSFGDRPAATIATVAVQKTAQIYENINKKASEKIIEDSYVDDIVTGDEDVQTVETLKDAIERILERGGFKIKGFVTSGDVSKETLSLLGSGEFGRVLGIGWQPEKDVFLIKVRINISKKYKSTRTEKDLNLAEIPSLMNHRITRRLLLSIVNSCYDPLGLLVPLTIQMKIGMRKLYNKELNLKWDDEVPEVIKRNWIDILCKVKNAEEVTFGRCIKAENAVGKPILLISSDGSEQAMCATAHIRWQCNDVIRCKLWAAKSRVAPLNKLTIPRLEMQAGVLGVRLSESIQRHSPWEFEKIYHIVDSECMLATLKKDTCALREFMGNRVAEILDSTTIQQWYHIDSKRNIADLGTRDNACVKDINEESEWQNGANWMYLPIEKWPLTQDIDHKKVPEEEILSNVFSGYAFSEDSGISYERYKGKSYMFILKLTARLLKVAETKSFRIGDIEPDNIEKAETFIIQNCMKLTRKELKKGRLESLRPEENSKGIICLGSRALEGLKMHYDGEEFPILMDDDPVSYLWMKKIHYEEHSGITKTVAKSRRRFWIVRGRKVAAKVKHMCYVCRLIDKVLSQQIMAPLPTNRLKMSPTFHIISLDLFGPYEIKDTVKQRTRKKVWGILFNCVSTRGVHIDVTEDYGTDAVLQTLRKFIALRGAPSLIYSDKGSQLLAASEDLKKWAYDNKIRWKTVPSEGQHQNGLSEALIKKIKRSLMHTIGKTVLTFSGLQMVFYEVASLINARPIGIVSGSDPKCPIAITPNHLILGRSTPEVVQGSLDNDENVNKRYRFLQRLVDDWWRQWFQTALPSLVPNYKWMQKHRNVKEGDVCLIKYSDIRRGSYRLGRVKNVKKEKDGYVRTVTLTYKNPGENVFREVDRPVQGISVIVPIEEQHQRLNPEAEVFVSQN